MTSKRSEGRIFPKGGENMLPLPPIKDPTLQKFCEERSLGPTLALAYQYAWKFYPTAQNIDIFFREPYCDSEAPYIVLKIKTATTPQEALDAENRFNQEMINLPGSEYIVTSHKFEDENATS